MIVKKFLKWSAIALIALILFAVAYGFIMHEPKPEGIPSPEADALAEKMLQAVNKTAWDSTALVSWTFRGGHHYLWDKERNFVRVDWDDKQVLLHTKTVTGKAFENGQEVTGDAANELIQTAWKLFCNDSFWMSAPFKVFDPGTSRSLATDDEGRQGLMITYQSGGVTPGDAYLWFLDENGMPQSYKMWVSIIPIGGLAFTWEDWATLPTGAKLAQMHKGALLDIPIDGLKSGENFADFGLESDPFLGL